MHYRGQIPTKTSSALNPFVVNSSRKFGENLLMGLSYATSTKLKTIKIAKTIAMVTVLDGYYPKPNQL